MRRADIIVVLLKVDIKAHLPNSMKSSTQTSVATMTSTVSPTLCHISAPILHAEKRRTKTCVSSGSQRRGQAMMFTESRSLRTAWLRIGASSLCLGSADGDGGTASASQAAHCSCGYLEGTKHKYDLKLRVLYRNTIDRH